MGSGRCSPHSAPCARLVAGDDRRGHSRRVSIHAPSGCFFLRASGGEAVAEETHWVLVTLFTFTIWFRIGVAPS